MLPSADDLRHCWLFLVVSLPWWKWSEVSCCYFRPKQLESRASTCSPFTCFISTPPSVTHHVKAVEDTLGNSHFHLLLKDSALSFISTSSIDWKHPSSPSLNPFKSFLCTKSIIQLLSPESFKEFLVRAWIQISVYKLQTFGRTLWVHCTNAQGKVQEFVLGLFLNYCKRFILKFQGGFLSSCSLGSLSFLCPTMPNICWSYKRNLYFSTFYTALCLSLSIWLKFEVF